MTVTLRPIRAEDADNLYPMVHQNENVTGNLKWDGPTSLEEFRASLARFGKATQEGEAHDFAILHDQSPIGSLSVRPYEDGFRADIGLWIGQPFQGRGLGTAAIREATRYAFDQLKMRKVEAEVFVGNLASRKAFEKAGFRLEGTIRRAALKQGRYLDDWILGILSEEF